MLKVLLTTLLLFMAIPSAMAQYTTLELLKDLKKQKDSAQLFISGETLYEKDPAFKKAVDRLMQPVGLELTDFDMSTIVTPKDFDTQSYTTHFWQKRLHAVGQYEDHELSMFLSYAPKTQKIAMVVFNTEGATLGDQVFYVLGDTKAKNLINNIIKHQYFDQSLTPRVMQKLK